MKLLEQTIKELKGAEIEDDIRATVNLRVDLRIDESYIPDMNQRLTVYRRMAGARSESELDRALAEVRDRYGAPPVSIENLADYALIRLLADRIGIESIDREAQVVVLKFRTEAKLDPQWLLRVLQGRQDLQLAPPATLKLDLKAQSPRPPLTQHRPQGGPSRPQKARGAGGSGAASWWTARATAGEVTGGFSKNEILRAAPEDPRGESGVFACVTALLRELSEGLTLR
jgi:hypothetical protein